MVAEAVRHDDRPDLRLVRYYPRGASARLFLTEANEVILSGPAGTGKTLSALWRLHSLAMAYRGMRGIMLRKTQEDLTASALVTYQERVLASGAYGVVPFGGSKIKPAGFHYPNGSRLLIGGLDKADKVMSRDYDVVYVNEAWEIEEDDWQKLTTRINRPGKVMPWNQVIGDTNPQGPGHWIYRRCHEANKATMLWSVHRDNPLLWDGADWTDAGRTYLATLDNLSGHLRARLLEGRWVAAEGAVYPGFDRRTHVKRVDCEGWATILALDVGTRDPTVLLTIRHAGAKFHVEREARAGMNADQILAEVAAEYARSQASRVVYDPSALLVGDALAKRRIAVRKGVNAIGEGVRRVNSVLADLTIDPSCAGLIREMENYRYPPGGAKDEPRPGDDHGPDALRYGVMDLISPPPRSVAAAGVAQASTWGPAR